MAASSARSNRPFIEELPELLAERGLSIRAVALKAGTTQPHLWRVLNRKNYKTPSADLVGRVAVALDLPRDYWPEYRVGAILDRIKEDAAFRDAVYRRL